MEQVGILSTLVNVRVFTNSVMPGLCEKSAMDELADGAFAIALENAWTVGSYNSGTRIISDFSTPYCSAKILAVFFCTLRGAGDERVDGNVFLIKALCHFRCVGFTPLV